MRVVLTRKFADIIDGVDLSSRKVGDVFDASADDARLLIAEQWAIADRRAVPRSSDGRGSTDASTAAPPDAAPKAVHGSPAGVPVANPQKPRPERHRA